MIAGAWSGIFKKALGKSISHNSFGLGCSGLVLDLEINIFPSLQLVSTLSRVKIAASLIPSK